MEHLILGSSGQIGAALSDYLMHCGETVISYDIIANPAQDLRFAGAGLAELVDHADFVHFLAFDVGGSVYLEKYQDTGDFIFNNMTIMANTFDCLAKSGTPFIFASTQMSNMGHSTYGMLKLLGERYTRTVGGLIVKFWNVYGVEHDPEKTHVITDFIKMARENDNIIMRTDGSEVRQFLHADDCSECLFRLSKNYHAISRDESLHITSFEWTTILEIAEMVSSEFSGAKICPATSVDNVQAGVRNEPSKDILRYWQPKILLSEGIKKVIAETA